MTRYSGPTDRPRRTYTPQQMVDSRAAWDAGRFSAEWREWRHLAAMKAGIIDPPAGSAMDSWGDDSPSQRAIVIRAIRETPSLLRIAILTAPRPSWSAVLEVLLRGRDDTFRDVEEDERNIAYRRRGDITPKQATYRLKEILQVIGDS